MIFLEFFLEIFLPLRWVVHTNFFCFRFQSSSVVFINNVDSGSSEESWWKLRRARGVSKILKLLNAFVAKDFPRNFLRLGVRGEGGGGAQRDV